MSKKSVLTPEDLLRLENLEGILRKAFAQPETDQITDYDRINPTQLLVKLDKLSGDVSPGRLGLVIGKYQGQFITLSQLMTIVFVNSDRTSAILELKEYDYYALRIRQPRTKQEKIAAIERIMQNIGLAVRLDMHPTLEQMNAARERNGQPPVEYDWQIPGQAKYEEDEPKPAANSAA